METKVEPQKNVSELYAYEGKAYEVFRNDLFEGLIPAELPSKPKELELGIHWKGEKIPFGTWAIIVKFLLWVHKNKKNEGHISLFYNTETGEWAPWAFPQQGSYAHVTVQDDSKEYIEQRKQFPCPWLLMGSVHHHSNMAAFASGTDQQDELHREGFHVTLGKMNQATLDIHFRVSINGQEVKTTLEEWIEIPDHFGGLHPLIKKHFQEFVTTPAYHEELYELSEYPQEQWKNNCTDIQVVTRGGWFGGNQGFFRGTDEVSGAKTRTLGQWTDKGKHFQPNGRIAKKEKTKKEVDEDLLQYLVASSRYKLPGALFSKIQGLSSAEITKEEHQLLYSFARHLFNLKLNYDLWELVHEKSEMLNYITEHQKNVLTTCYHTVEERIREDMSKYGSLGVVTGERHFSEKVYTLLLKYELA